jgi:DNA-binding cell septation regulator SpoVG
MTFDNAFVVRNVKVIEGNKGLFVAMPSRKLREACQKCNFKNPVRSKFCSQCGSSLPVAERRPQSDDDQAQQSEHRDIAHPITLECREYIQKKVLDAYESEKRGASQGAASQGAPRERQHRKPTPPPQERKQEAPGHRQFIDEDTIEGGDIEL